MRKSRFTESQIITILKAVEAGRTVKDVCREHGVTLEFIKPGKPTQNGYVERFNRTYRTEILDYYLFSDLDEVRDITSRWMREYNEERPHESLGDLTPHEYRERATSPENL